MVPTLKKMTPNKYHRFLHSSLRPSVSQSTATTFKLANLSFVVAPKILRGPISFCKSLQMQNYVFSTVAAALMLMLSTVAYSCLWLLSVLPSHRVEFRGLFPALIAHLNSNVFVPSPQFLIQPPNRVLQKREIKRETISSQICSIL